MKAMLRYAVVGSLFSACVATFSVQAQTAVPGPGSTNATVDAQNLDQKSNSGENAPSSATRGVKKQTSDGESAGSETPTSGDGSSDTKPSSVTQPIQGNLETTSDVARDCTTLSGSDKATCERKEGRP